MDAGGWALDAGSWAAVSRPGRGGGGRRAAAGPGAGGGGRGRGLSIITESWGRQAQTAAAGADSDH